MIMMSLDSMFPLATPIAYSAQNQNKKRVH
jgi:hypothetical protein